MPKKRKNRNKAEGRTLEEAVYIFIIAILLLLIILFAAKTYDNYHAYQQRHDYFQQKNITVQPWMTLKEINHNFNITYSEIYSAIGNTTGVNIHISLDRYCIVYNKNCTQIVSELNDITK